MNDVGPEFLFWSDPESSADEPFKTPRIISAKQDSESSNKTKNNSLTTNRPLQWLSNKQSKVYYLALFILISIPMAALAHSVMEPASSVHERELVERPVTAQTTPLLEQSSAGAMGGGSIDIIGDSTLVPSLSNGRLSGDEDFVSSDSSGRQTSIYVVREGDSLSEIAEMFDVSVDTVVWANNLEGETIQQGEILIILPIDGVRHVAKEGDTVASIARKYDADVEEIVTYNELDEAGSLQIGAIIDVPGGSMSEQQSQPKREVTASNTQVSGAAVAPRNAPSLSGYYMHPVPGSVVTQRLHGYNAVDFGAPIGTSILAAASGMVKRSVEGGWNGGYGSFIVIEHDNGTETLYSHNSSNIVSVGQRVVQGQVIGYIGSTGRSTGPHLHFEVRGASNPFRTCRTLSACGSHSH